MENQNLSETKKNQKTVAYLLLSLFGLLIVRLLPILKAPLSTYGYDYGFYAYGIKYLIAPTLESFFPVIWGGYNNPLFYLSKILNIPGNIILNELYLLAAIFLGVALFLFFGKKNKLAGIFAVILVAASIIQSEAYTMFLWKSLVALPFLVLGFKFFIEKRYWPFALSSLAILLTHRTTAIIFFLSLALYFLFIQIKNKKIFWLIAEALISGLILFLLWPVFQNYFLTFFLNANSAVKEGIFLNSKSFVSILWAPVLLAIPGVVLYIKNKEHPLLTVFTSLIIVWLIFHLPFYRRMLIFLDISLILYGAYFLAKVNLHKKIFKFALAFIILFLVVRGFSFTWNKQPLIFQTDVQEIQNFNREGFVLATSAEDGPWLLAWLKKARLAAPGMFEDNKSESQWRDFWSGRYSQEFLYTYPRPLYLYQRSFKIPGSVNNCLKPVSKNFFKYTCK